MTREQRSAVRVASATAALFWAALGLLLGWAVWAWVVLMVLTLIAPSLLAEWISRRLHERRIREHQMAAPQVPVVEPRAPEQYRLPATPLRSSRPDYRLIFSCTVWWRRSPHEPRLPHADPGSLAAEMVLDQARQLATTAAPDEVELARQKLTSLLGTLHADQSGRVEAWVTDVVLELPESDAERLRRLADVRKEEEVWEHERNHERNKRAYLGDDVLKSAGSALVWWLARDESQVDDAVEKIPNLRKLTAAAQDRRVPDLDVDAVELSPEEQLVELIRGLEPDDAEKRIHLGDSLAEVLEMRGYRELAAQLRAAFDTPAASEAQSEPVDASVNGHGPVGE